MKTTIRIAISLLLLAGSSLSNATPITFSDMVDPNPDQLISFSNGDGGNNQSYSFTHSIISDLGPLNSGTYGYNPLTDVISSALLTLHFKDEAQGDGAESVSFTFDGSSFGTQTITDWASGNFAPLYTAVFSSSSLDSLLSDGILQVTLDNAGQTNGHQNDRSDFLFLDSTLSITADRTAPEGRAGILVQAVPEPATLSLMGLSLVGLVATRRRKKID